MSSDAPPTPQKESEGRESELKKQEMLVQYLKDTECFALQVERAIAVINNMLYWKTTTGKKKICDIGPQNLVAWVYLFANRQKNVWVNYLSYANVP